MSTNPFRRINPQQNQGSSISYPQSESAFGTPDGSGLTSKDLSVDTRVPPSSLDRHVSFASPPVDSTIPAASYPSSPESARSPIQYGQHFTPHTPDYRTALHSDPFDELRQENREDRTIWQALQNTQNNVILSEQSVAVDQHNAVRNTLSRFASAPRADPPARVNNATNHQVPSRQSMDVDAFKRLLLTGESGQNAPSVPSLGSIQSAAKGLGDSGYGTDTASISQSSVIESNVLDTEEVVKLSNDHEFSHDPSHKQIPPPAPAPRRGKSVKAKTSLPAESTDIDGKIQQDRLEAEKPLSKSNTAKKPPAPPLARRQSHKIANQRNEEANISSLSNDSDPSSSFPINDQPQHPKGPPPPPVRRQGTSTSEIQRRVSHDLAPTAEEPEADGYANNAPSNSFISSSSRESSNAPPIPPVSRSRNSSISTTTTKQSNSGASGGGGNGSMNPPPLPPPRRGRGSSRSSFDSFSRPAVATLMGMGTGAGGDENSSTAGESMQQSRRRMSGHRQSEQEKGKDMQRDVSMLNPSNANSILAELADLQREVDAARRGA